MVETIDFPYKQTGVYFDESKSIDELNSVSEALNIKTPGFKRKYRVLSLDGGGIRGVMVARILQRLSAALPDVMSQFDMFAGTSTGSILASAFAAGIPPSEAVKLYTKLANSVFSDSLWDNVMDLGMVIGAQYDQDELQKHLKTIFGELRLENLEKKILIATFDTKSEETSTWKPKFLHNFEGDDSDGDWRVSEAILASTAAPVFFPIYNGYIDGGVVANNPSVCAYAQVMNFVGGYTDVRLLSMGTGKNPMYVDIDSGYEDWGVIQWIPELLYIMMDGGVGIADYQARTLLGSRYHRVNPTLKSKMPLDGILYIPELLKIADNLDMAPIVQWAKDNLYD